MNMMFLMGTNLCFSLLEWGVTRTKWSSLYINDVDNLIIQGKFTLHVSLVWLQDKPFVLLGYPVEMCRLGNIHPYNRVILIVKQSNWLFATSTLKRVGKHWVASRKYHTSSPQLKLLKKKKPISLPSTCVVSLRRCHTFKTSTPNQNHNSKLKVCNIKCIDWTLRRVLKIKTDQKTRVNTNLQDRSSHRNSLRISLQLSECSVVRKFSHIICSFSWSIVETGPVSAVPSFCRMQNKCHQEYRGKVDCLVC